MEILVGDVVSVQITSLHGDTHVVGPIVQIGLDPRKEGIYYFQIAGLTATFWSDEVGEVKRIG